MKKCEMDELYCIFEDINMVYNTLIEIRKAKGHLGDLSLWKYNMKINFNGRICED
jgi:hypothetical protein